MEFEDDPSAPGGRIWRNPIGPAALSGTAVAFCLLVALLVIAIPFLGGVRTALSDPTPLAFIAPLAAFLSVMALYCWRDMRGKLGGVIRLDAAGINLQLAAGRSLIHHPPACRETVPYADVAAVEERLEAYPSQGMSILQRAYRLTRLSAPPIFLFEERALGTRSASFDMQRLALEIAERAGAPIHDLGLVKGGGGFLGVLFVRVPDWSTPAVSADQRDALLRRSNRTGWLVSLVVVVVVLIVVISFFF